MANVAKSRFDCSTIARMASSSLCQQTVYHNIPKDSLISMFEHKCYFLHGQHAWNIPFVLSYDASFIHFSIPLATKRLNENVNYLLESYNTQVYHTALAFSFPKHHKIEFELA